MSKLCRYMILIVAVMFVFVPYVYADENTSNSTSSENSSNYAEFMQTGKYKSCGGSGNSALVKNIPEIIPSITKMVYNALMIVTPTILVVMGSIDLFRGIMSSKEDEIKKGRDSFLRRLIASVIVFLVVLGVKLIVGLVAGSSSNSTKIIDCINCFVSNECS